MNIPLSTETILLLLIVLFVAIMTLIYHARVISGKQPIYRRPISAFDVTRKALERGAETGRSIHLSPGSGAIGGRATTAETVAGLLAAERLAAEAALHGAPVLASSGDAVAHLALRGFLRQAYQRAGMGQDYDPNNVQLLAHQDPMAYASGIMTLHGRQRLEASQLIGSFGQEVLLASEDGAQRGVSQLAGAAATNTLALPLVYLTAEGTLIGEEIYAAEVYLSRVPAPHARLLTQDLLRTAVIVIIVILMILVAVGLPLSL